MWTLLLLLMSLALQSALGLVEEFEAFDRKVFKRKKQRYATFDEKGIMTLDGTVNGKSNDISFPNTLSGDIGGDNQVGQPVCRKNPVLLFEICETQRLGPWTGLAICYASQLNQAYVNPFFRTQTEGSDSRKRLIRVMCGPRQSAIFLDRETPVNMKPNVTGAPDEWVLPKKEREENDSSLPYNHFYSISTSFAPEKLYFRIPDDPSQKRCAILELGGKTMTRMRLQTLQRQDIEDVFEPVPDGSDTRLMRVNQNESSKFNQKLPDLANRKFRISHDQGLWLLMLDFSPPYMRLQDISMYGWLPVRIKITGQAIQPCRVEWAFLQSREVSGNGLKAKLCIEYTVETSVQKSNNQNKGSSNSSSKQEESSDRKGYGAGVNIPLLQGLLNIGVDFKQSFSNSQGSSSDTSSFSQESLAFSGFESKTRTERMIFPDFSGTINIEQLMFKCHGIEIKVDKIRYVDPTGEELFPTNADTSEDEEDDYSEAEQNPLPIKGEKCKDDFVECPIWARQGQCQKTPVFMLTKCRFSCKICVIVAVERKGSDPFADADKEPQPPCRDLQDACLAWKESGECNKNPFLMSQICRRSCDLCVGKSDFKAIKKEWRMNEGLDDYDYAYDQNQKSSG